MTPDTNRGGGHIEPSPYPAGDAPMCRRCGLRHPGPDHETECAWQAYQRSRVTRLAAVRGIPQATAADLWAHLQTATGLCAEGAATAACRSIDLGWRAVIASDASRLWDREKEFGHG